MTRRARILAGLVAGALVSPWLPLYVARSLTRAFVSGGGGDVISYAWRRHTLPSFLDAMHYMRPEESPQRYLALNLALAAVYAGAIAWLVARALARVRR